MRSRLLVIVLVSGLFAGCGTTKWTDTRRSATEQLLISDSMDRAVSQMDLRSLAGKTVYLDAGPLKEVIDADYLTSSLRQHMLASGCILKDNQSEADYVVEARAGGVGTDHHDVTYGIPRINIPALIPVGGFGIPPQIPEVPFAKRDDQRAISKIAVFAYNRKTGRPVWQSGTISAESNAKAIWVFGAGPFQRGSIYEGTTIAGDRLKIPLVDLDDKRGGIDPVSVAVEANFREPKAELAQNEAKPNPEDGGSPPEPTNQAKPAGPGSEVVQAGHAPPTAAEAAETPSEAAPAGEPDNQKPEAAQEPATLMPPSGAARIDPAAPLPPPLSRFSGPPIPGLPWPEDESPER